MPLAAKLLAQRVVGLLIEFRQAGGHVNLPWQRVSHQKHAQDFCKPSSCSTSSALRMAGLVEPK
jgi:hypothetical protein